VRQTERPLAGLGEARDQVGAEVCAVVHAGAGTQVHERVGPGVFGVQD
jgi:hypothetical protein